MRKFVTNPKVWIVPVLALALTTLPAIVNAQSGSGKRGNGSGSGSGFSSTITDAPVNENIGYLVAAALILGVVQIYYRKMKKALPQL